MVEYTFGCKSSKAGWSSNIELKQILHYKYSNTISELLYSYICSVSLS